MKRVFTRPSGLVHGRIDYKKQRMAKRVDDLSLPPSLGLPSDDYQRRLQPITDAYCEIVKELNCQAVLSHMLASTLTPSQKSLLKHVRDKNPKPESIIQLVERNLSSNIYDAFVDSLEKIHPKLYAKLDFPKGSQHEDPDSSGYYSHSTHSSEQTGHGSADSYSSQKLPYAEVKLEPIKHDEDFATLHGILLNLPSVDKKEVRTLEEFETADPGSVSVLILLDQDIYDGDIQKLVLGLRQHTSLTGFHIIAKNMKTSSIRDVLLNLSDRSALEKLSFIGAGYVDEFELLLKRTGNLSQLCLDQCKFSPSNWTTIAPLIKEMNKLESLSLNDTLMADEGTRHLAEALEGNVSLKELCLGRNEISDYGVECVARCLNNKQNLEHLSLAGNQISDKGAITLAQVDRTECRPCKVDLTDNQIGKRGAVAILGNWEPTEKKRHSFNFDNNQISSLAADTEKTYSWVGNTTGKRRTNILTKRLSRGESFRTIDLGGMELKDGDIENLCALLSADGKLEQIDLSSNCLTEMCLPFLTQLYHRCEKLTVVNIRKNQIADSNIVEIFSSQLQTIRDGNPNTPFFLQRKFWDIVTKANLNGIHLNQITLSRYCIRILFALIKDEAIREIKIEDCKLNTDDIKKICTHAFTEPAGTTTFVLIRNYLETSIISILTESFTKFISQFSLGKRLNFEKNKDLVLSKFVLIENNINHSAVKLLSESIFKCPSLTHIDLSNNGLGPEGCKHINKYLSGNPPLVSLNLAGNTIYSHGLATLCKALLKKSKLKHLNLAHNEINPRGIMPIAEVLDKNKCLEFLDLSDNFLGQEKERFPVLIRKLKENRILKTLRVRNNSLTDDDICQLAKTLGQTDGGLSKLDIGNNKMGTKGYEAVIDALKIGKIKYLDISDYYGLNANIDLLCSTLELGEAVPHYLGLRNTQITDENLEGLAEALGKGFQARPNKSQAETVLDVTGKKISKETLEKLVTIRTTYGSPRCVLKNEDRDFFGSPF